MAGNRLRGTKELEGAPEALVLQKNIGPIWGGRCQFSVNIFSSFQIF